MQITKYGYKINPVTTGAKNNWLFTPGGPGLGSEYLLGFCAKLQVPGNKLLIDFPMDGVNQNGKLDLQFWKEGLIDLLKMHDKPILVAHSFSGMLALNMPEIKEYLSGLVLMNTTTHNSFFQHVNDMRLKHDLPDLVPAASAYHLNPCDATYKKFWDTYKYYCFTPEELPLGEKMIQLFAFNSQAYHFAIADFFPVYECTCSPTDIPVMTMAGESDFVCPPDVFISDSRFHSANISNRVIKQAGHCPWLLHFESVQNCFNLFRS